VTRVTRRRLLGLGALAAIAACTRAVTPVRSSGPATALPSPTPASRVTLDAALRTRRSVRSFTEQPLDDDVIARLLWAAQGQTVATGGRTAPSAGALYPIELYRATADGLARYVSSHDAIEPITSEDRRGAIAVATGGQAAAMHAPLLVVITGVVARTEAKYGARAERYVHLEAGHVCQNLLLEATALGLGAVPIGSFDDDLVRAALGSDEVPLYVVATGHTSVS
jgi:SagB-type dehydrogenase family enzyme